MLLVWGQVNDPRAKIFRGLGMIRRLVMADARGHRLVCLHAGVLKGAGSMYILFHKMRCEGTMGTRWQLSLLLALSYVGVCPLRVGVGGGLQSGEEA